MLGFFILYRVISGIRNKYVEYLSQKSKDDEFYYMFWNYYYAIFRLKTFKISLNREETYILLTTYQYFLLIEANFIS